MKKGYWILALVFLADLLLIGFGKNDYRLATKTLLMPILVFIYWRESKQNTTVEFNLFFFLGLVFSFLGDLFLLFDWGFLAGLGSFFIAHILYCITFFRKKIKRPSVLMAIAIFAYAVLLVSYLYPSLGEMKIPVMAYAGILATMLYACISTQRKLLIIGGALFVVSDSLLSMHLFVYKEIGIGLGVMITYVLAQYFLVKGMLKN